MSWGSGQLSLQELWDCPPLETGNYNPDQPPNPAEAAGNYFAHAIRRGTRLASAVRLKMHGEIKLGRWMPFTAEQVIRRGRGMIWQATVYKGFIPIRGFDRMVDGKGSTQWKIFGIFPVMVASGPDITRSAIGRVQVESIWLPSALGETKVAWTEAGSLHPHAHFVIETETTDLALTLDSTGRVTSAALSRWGNPEGAAFHYADFGGVFEEEATFDGYTIPTRVRAGWFFGTDRFESDGEFFRASINHASFR